MILITWPALFWTFCGVRIFPSAKNPVLRLLCALPLGTFQGLFSICSNHGLRSLNHVWSVTLVPRALQPIVQNGSFQLSKWAFKQWFSGEPVSPSNFHGYIHCPMNVPNFFIPFITPLKYLLCFFFGEKRAAVKLQELVCLCLCLFQPL
jgi:hypothetical protein